MYRVGNVYRLLPPDFFKGNYETYVVNTNDGHMLAFNRKTKQYDVVKGNKATGRKARIVRWY